MLARSVTWHSHVHSVIHNPDLHLLCWPQAVPLYVWLPAVLFVVSAHGAASTSDGSSVHSDITQEHPIITSSSAIAADDPTDGAIVSGNRDGSPKADPGNRAVDPGSTTHDYWLPRPEGDVSGTADLTQEQIASLSMAAVEKTAESLRIVEEDEAMQAGVGSAASQQV
jgi:hypothetical protein